MAKPFSPAARRRYDAVRLGIRSRMRATDRSGRITLAELAAALRAAGSERSERYLRAVLSGEKVSRPALRELSAAVRAVRARRERGVPEWL